MDVETGVPVARHPDAIQREIEVTRAELAEAIDAIAEKVSPKRVAARGAEQVKAKVAELRASDTALRTDRVVAAGVAVTAAVVAVVVVRRRRARRRTSRVDRLLGR